MHEIHLQLESNHIDTVCEQLYELETLAITINDQSGQPIYEPKPNEIKFWSTVNLVALFPSIDAAQTAAMTLQPHPFIGKISIKNVPQMDWVRESLKQFSSTKFGERLWVCPSWEPPPDSEAVNVLLDPGLAFGTGTHPTTALCLAWLGAHCRQKMSIIDYGCGSGILALAALKLGAAHATAVDYDPQALEACKNNAALNNIYDTQLHVCLPENLQPIQVDIVIANILAQPIIANKSLFANRVKAGGYLALSGILKEQANEVMQAFEQDFILYPIQQQEDWVLISGKRRS